MKIAYISGPYSAKTVKQRDKNIRAAWKVGNEIAKLGWMPLVPHCNSAHMDDAQGHDFWIGGGLLLMRRVADLVVLIPGWKDSPGAQKEVKVAMQLGLPVYHWPADRENLAVLAQDRT